MAFFSVSISSFWVKKKILFGWISFCTFGLLWGFVYISSRNVTWDLTQQFLLKAIKCFDLHEDKLVCRLDERKRRKDFILERNLLYPNPFEKDLLPEERAICRRYDVFMCFHSKEEHEELLQTVIAEHRTMKRIQELKVWYLTDFGLLYLLDSVILFESKMLLDANPFFSYQLEYIVHKHMPELISVVLKSHVTKNISCRGAMSFLSICKHACLILKVRMHGVDFVSNCWLPFPLGSSYSLNLWAVVWYLQSTHMGIALLIPSTNLVI